MYKSNIIYKTIGNSRNQKMTVIW